LATIELIQRKQDLSEKERDKTSFLENACRFFTSQKTSKAVEAADIIFTSAERLKSDGLWTVTVYTKNGKEIENVVARDRKGYNLKTEMAKAGVPFAELPKTDGQMYINANQEISCKPEYIWSPGSADKILMSVRLKNGSFFLIHADDVEKRLEEAKQQVKQQEQTPVSLPVRKVGGFFLFLKRSKELTI
jgi:hypothetical protein